MREVTDWTVKAAGQSRPCPACRCWTQPYNLRAGPGFVRAQFKCWGCRARYDVDYQREVFDDPANRGQIPGGQNGRRRG
jgi:hypothetical protein